MNVVRVFLFPFAMLYGLVTAIRNRLFDWGILPSHSFNHPIIGIGNLSTGGTGKTPHIEYMIQLLKPLYRLATLSRGYKRKSKGFQLAHASSTVNDIGDEPLQLYIKHPEVTVAVCEKRYEGVKKLLAQKPDNQVVLLDDVFQHRYIKPGLNILLTDYHNIFTKNFILPTGNLRESRCNAQRADALIVTKTPNVFSPLDRKLILKDLKKYHLNNVFFSYIKYGSWKPVSPYAAEERQQDAKTIFLITGIANPVPLGEHLKRLCTDLNVFRFADHYQFKEKDLERVIEKFHATYSGTKAIITTEKDSMRMRDPKIKKLIKNIPLYYVPIEVDFHGKDKDKFDHLILNYLENFNPEEL